MYFAWAPNTVSNEIQQFPHRTKLYINKRKWFAGTPTMQTRNNGGSGFCNELAYENILIIINTMHCLDIHKKNTIIHHWLQEEMLTTKGDLGFFHFQYISEFAQIHVSKQKHGLH